MVVVIIGVVVVVIIIMSEECMRGSSIAGGRNCVRQVLLLLALSINCYTTSLYRKKLMNNREKRYIKQE